MTAIILVIHKMVRSNEEDSMGGTDLQIIPNKMSKKTK